MYISLGVALSLPRRQFTVSFHLRIYDVHLMCDVFIVLAYLVCDIGVVIKVEFVYLIKVFQVYIRYFIRHNKST